MEEGELGQFHATFSKSRNGIVDSDNLDRRTRILEEGRKTGVFTLIPTGHIWPMEPYHLARKGPQRSENLVMGSDSRSCCSPSANCPDLWGALQAW